jgi:hypothetical protein
MTGLNLIIYTSDYDDRFPPTSKWMDRDKPYAKDESVFHCPLLNQPSPDAYGHVYYAGVSRKKQGEIKDPITTPLAFDSDLLRRSAATMAVPKGPIDRMERPSICYADGHAKRTAAVAKR